MVRRGSEVRRPVTCRDLGNADADISGCYSALTATYQSEVGILSASLTMPPENVLSHRNRLQLKSGDKKESCTEGSIGKDIPTCAQHFTTCGVARQLIPGT